MRPNRLPLLVLCSMLAAAATAVTSAEAPVDALSQLPAHVTVDERFHVSAQPTAEAIVKLPSAGVRTVINLRPASETPDLDEKGIVEKAGMKYVSLPVAGAAGLTRDNVLAFDQAMAAADGGKVLMHCASGNRVGAMMALRARWIQGKSADEALAIGKSSGLKGLEGDVKALLQPEPPKVDVVSAPSAYRQQQ
jgi:uncharacterized protein (TIGR01244 family)